MREVPVRYKYIFSKNEDKKKNVKKRRNRTSVSVVESP